MKQIIFILLAISIFACSGTKKEALQNESIIIQTSANSTPIEIQFIKGAKYNHPTFAIWTEDLEGNYLHTLYVTRSVSKSKYGHGFISENVWSPDSGTSIRKATLPYWLHKVTNNSVHTINSDKPIVPDGYTSATPVSNFSISTNLQTETPTKFRILMEINQAWDWNSYWNNGKYPNSFEYKTSAQPSLIYAVTIDLHSSNKEYYLNPIGHGHYAGEDGNLYTNLEGFTSALQIVKSVIITLK